MEYNDSIQIYEESFVKHTTFYNDSLSLLPSGEVGDPVPYLLHADPLIIFILTVCVSLTAMMFKNSVRFTRFQFNHLFRLPRENSIGLRETAKETRYQRYFPWQFAIVVGIFTYVFTSSRHTFFASPHRMMAIYVFIAFAYIAVRWTLCHIVDAVFFARRIRHLSNISQLFILALQSSIVLIFTLLTIYLGLSADVALKIVVVTFFFTYLLQFYRHFTIFFKKKGAYMEFFLYLCTLEVVPLVLMTGFMLYATNYFVVSF